MYFMYFFQAEDGIREREIELCPVRNSFEQGVAGRDDIIPTHLRYSRALELQHLAFEDGHARARGLLALLEQYLHSQAHADRRNPGHDPLPQLWQDRPQGIHARTATAHSEK